MTHRILHHEDMNPGDPDIATWLARIWTHSGMGRPPTTDNVRGSVNAYVNHGRWVVDCPALCGGAQLASRETPVFLCAECGSPENDGAWYRVTFPRDKAAIEATLLKRPARRADHAVTRNWTPDETVADLRAENARHGVT